MPPKAPCTKSGGIQNTERNDGFIIKINVTVGTGCQQFGQVMSHMVLDIVTIVTRGWSSHPDGQSFQKTKTHQKHIMRARLLLREACSVVEPPPKFRPPTKNKGEKNKIKVFAVLKKGQVFFLL